MARKRYTAEQVIGLLQPAGAELDCLPAILKRTLPALRSRPQDQLHAPEVEGNRVASEERV